MTEDSNRTRHRELEHEYLDTLLNSLTVDQLRSASQNLLGPDARAGRTRAEAIDYITTSRTSQSAMIEALLEIEAQTPTRHCLLTKFTGNLPSDISSGPLPSESTPAFSIARFDKANPATLTAEHTVLIREWERTSESTKTLVSRRLRHPVVVRFYEADSLALFCYPGFSQGAGTPPAERLQYESVIQALASDLSSAFGLQFSPLGVERALTLLDGTSSERVRILRGDLEARDGRLLLSPSGTDLSIRDYLVQVLSPYVRESVFPEVAEAIAAAMKDALPNALVALWLREELVTRLRFWDIGTDFMFLWRGTARSFALVESILNLIAGVAHTLSQPLFEDIWQSILEARPGTLLIPGLLSHTLGAEPKSTRQMLVKATDAGILEPVYRVRTSHILFETKNDWTPHLSRLSQVFTTDEGVEIDGGDPLNIEVAFRRKPAEATS